MSRSTPGERTHVSEVSVRYAETDGQGVAYHAEYLVWMEVGRTDYLRAVGFPYARLEEEGLFFSVVEAKVRYHGAARYDDRVTIETRCTSLRSRTVTFAYELKVGERRVAAGETVLVALGPGRSARRIPDPVARALASHGAQ